MAQVVSPVLVSVQRHVQAVNNVYELEPVNFGLASDEAIELVAAEMGVQIVFPAGTSDAVHHVLLTMDPNPPAVARAAIGNILNEFEDDDTIAEYRMMIDLVTSGYANPIPYQHMTSFPEGLITARDVNFAFASNNVGAEMYGRLFYRVVRLSDQELVSLVARRRA